jgi:hypothetical protein
MFGIFVGRQAVFSVLLAKCIVKKQFWKSRFVRPSIVYEQESETLVMMTTPPPRTTT